MLLASLTLPASVSKLSPTHRSATSPLNPSLTRSAQPVNTLPSTLITPWTMTGSSEKASRQVPLRQERKSRMRSSFASFSTYFPDAEAGRSSERPASGSVRAVLYVLRIFILIGSMSIIGFSAHALDLFKKSQFTTVPGGAEGIEFAWPENINLTPARLLLAIGVLNMAFSATVLSLQFISGWRKTESWINIAWVAGIVLGVLSLIFWFVTIIVYQVMAKKSAPTLSAWACAKREAATNVVVGYDTVCNTETTSAMTAVILAVFEGLIVLCYGAIALLQKQGDQTAQDLKLQVEV